MELAPKQRMAEAYPSEQGPGCRLGVLEFTVRCGQRKPQE